MTTAVQPAHNNVIANGMRLHYVDFGAPHPDATKMVFLHGMFANWESFRRIQEHFAPDYHVLALDQRGHGQSEWSPTPEWYDTESYVADFEAWVDAVGLDRFVLVGQSMGGHNSLLYAWRHPHRVICAVINDIPPAKKIPTDPESRQKRLPGGKHRVYATWEQWMERRQAANPTTPAWAHQLDAEQLLIPTDEGWIPNWDPLAQVGWVPQDLWPMMPEITRPMLFIRGGQSEVVGAQKLQDMVMATPHARSVTLERAGHATYQDMEREWIAVASAFVAAHAGDSGSPRSLAMA